MKKILIADDSDTMRKIVKMILEKEGYAIVEAKDGCQAVELAKSELPNVILLDAEMPSMDGWEACKTIKSDPLTAAIPIFMCTGHDLSDESEQLLEVKANGYVTKPYSPAQLLAKISEV